MNPEVVAAIIAASVSFLTLIGTLVVQYLGRRATSRDTQKTLEQQREQLDRTLTEQREQLDRTLTEQRTRTLNERFATAAEQLGSDKPAVRLAGVYAMAGLADDWKENRQTCVDVLCAYLRMPYEPDSGPDAPEVRRLAFQAIREVRHTVIRVITAHLQKDAAASWQGLDLDFTGIVFDGGDFTGARFSSGTVDFRDTRFTSATVSFNRAEFTSGEVDFGDARFTSGTVSFNRVLFSGGTVSFNGARFSGGLVTFGDAEFSGGTVSFGDARFTSGTVSFNRVLFSGGTVSFGGTEFTFRGIPFTFDGARFSGSDVTFDDALFFGSTVTFDGAEFSGGTVDFSDTGDWSFPPAFPWTDTLPSGVKLPKLAQ
jgi:uncharacterized protein YjbI with pentapeptide repeats